MDTATTCVICHRDLWDYELGRFACLLCQNRGVELLQAMPGLYVQTGRRLMPGAAGSGGRVSGSKSAPLPCSEAALNLRGPGGMVTHLADWERALRHELDYGPAPFRGDYEQALVGITGWLVNAAPWVYASFAAVDEYHRELAQIAGHARAIATGERPARTVPVRCPCGAVLRITLDTPGRRCTCGQQYGWAELRQLPLAERAAA